MLNETSNLSHVVCIGNNEAAFNSTNDQSEIKL